MQLINFTLADEQSVAYAERLLSVVESTEQEQHIVENMVGDVAWSLKNILRNKTRCATGFISMLTDNGTLVGISGCEKTDNVFVGSVQFGIRLWVNPAYRHLRIPTRVLTPAIHSAYQLKTIAWTSFNNDRAGMLRMIKVRSVDENTQVKNLWDGFSQLPEQVTLFNTRQWIAYKDFSNT